MVFDYSSRINRENREVREDSKKCHQSYLYYLFYYSPRAREEIGKTGRIDFPVLPDTR